MEEGRNTERLTFGEGLLCSGTGVFITLRGEQSLDPQLQSCLPTHQECHT
jgi:hypothetical protein